MTAYGTNFFLNERCERMLSTGVSRTAGWRFLTDTAAVCLSGIANTDDFHWLTVAVVSRVTGSYGLKSAIVKGNATLFHQNRFQRRRAVDCYGHGHIRCHQRAATTMVDMNAKVPHAGLQRILVKGGHRASERQGHSIRIHRGPRADNDIV